MNKKWVMINLLIRKSGISRAEYLRKHKIFYSIGEHCYYHPINIPSEPYLVNIHNNVVIAGGVELITHDVIDYMINYKETKGEKVEQHIGRIEIMDNVFIGKNSIINSNIKVGANSIIAAGSVVISDVPDNTIVGGNPAKVIGKTSELIKKRKYEKGPFKSDGKKEIIRSYWGK